MDNILCFAAANNDNVNDNDNTNNIFFTIKDTKLYIPVIILSARDNQKLLDHILLELIDYFVSVFKSRSWL